MEDGMGTRVGSSGGSTRYFRKLWHLNVHSKINVFLRKDIHAILPTRFHLAARGIKVDNICPLCNVFPEHSFHALWICIDVQKVWENSALWPILSRFKGQSFLDLWHWVLLSGNEEDLGCFAIVSWSIWLAKNQFVHLGKKLQPNEVVSRESLLWEFLSCQLVNSPKHSNSNLPSSWQASPADTINNNVDATVVHGSPRVGIGVVARDDLGAVLLALTKVLDGSFSAHLADLLLASHHQRNNVIIETDASNVAKFIAGSLHLTKEEDIVSFFHQLSSRFSSFQVQQCRHTANVVAHILASDGLVRV
ncbi:uncharacterized protein [Henckelia pumila]|uniref:uncharacterized protein n=1 Tax=Henckelia pumila TaxID=405737 RepID=UPI003C6E1BA2